MHELEDMFTAECLLSYYLLIGMSWLQYIRLPSPHHGGKCAIVDPQE